MAWPKIAAAPSRRAPMSSSARWAFWLVGSSTSSRTAAAAARLRPKTQFASPLFALKANSLYTGGRPSVHRRNSICALTLARAETPGSTPALAAPREKQRARAMGGFEEIVRRPGRPGLAAGGHPHGPHSRRFRRPHVGFAVADHYGLVRARSQFAHSLSEHSRLGLPAVAAVAGSMRADVDRLERETLRRQHGLEPVMNLPEGRGVKKPARDS